MKKKTIIIVVLALAVCALGIWAFTSGPLASSDTQGEDEEERANPVGPKFDADSAYAFCKAQCDFGPRDMNSDGHAKCLQWIAGKFQQYGCQVEEQKADLTGWDGTTLHATNIIAHWNPKAQTRILLCAHWDSRPWADNDPDSANWRKPIIAANDAASGVAVMIELARLLTANAKGLQSDIGIDFVCFDAEDWGVPQWSSHDDDGNSWALGAQHWAQAVAGQGSGATLPAYGILLDMVGGRGAKFYQEGVSLQYAPDIVNKVWKAARQAGYGSFFPKSQGGFITDDHGPVNQVAGIPCIDIIPYFPDYSRSSFGPTWHTLADNMDDISTETLKAVGQTLVQLLWTE